LTVLASPAAAEGVSPLLRALGRREREFDLRRPLEMLRRERVLVTGAAGEIGRPLVERLQEAGVRVFPTDINGEATHMDVRVVESVRRIVAYFDPTVVVNLAAAKLAPAGEIDPWRAASVNVNGVVNLLETGVRVVQASTGKAVEPQTCYGASKLIAERMVLNRGGTVVRYVNVPEAGPSMVTIWEALGEDEPIPVTPCTRYVMTLNEAIGLTVWAAVLPAGRYKLDAGPEVMISEYAARYFPGRALIGMPLRRGDRRDEPHHGTHEGIVSTEVPWIERVVGNGDE
jgi:FlaA1/EpsC-like NDP-sugar epimerase